MNQRRALRRRIDGVLMIDKPPGMTSNGVLGVIKRLYQASKAGHTGTLDPFATGLLPVALGEATKFSGHLIQADKTYLATALLGVTTSTGDAEGEVVRRCDLRPSAESVEQAMRRFVGLILQVPPMYSALKRDGKPLYAYAREGVVLHREAREVTIHALALLELQWPLLQFRVCCSKGTYIRTLAEDIGAALGCGAHLVQLRREKTGGFDVSDALTLEAIEEAAMPERVRLLRPVDGLVADYPRIELDAGMAARLRLGQRLPWGTAGVSQAGHYRTYAENGQFLGLVHAVDGGLRPERLVAQASPDI